MTPSSLHVQALVDVAADWRDPDHAPRARAVEETVDAPNRWTEPALTHAVDRWMEQLTTENLIRWIGEGGPSRSICAGVVHAETGPLAGFRDALAVWALGHAYVGVVPSGSPALLPAFGEELTERDSGLQIQFADDEAVYEEAEAVLAQADNSGTSIHEACEAHGIPPSRRLVRSPVYSIAVLDGHETDDERGRLAEDMLLFDGMGRRRLAILWAPRDHSPDAYLEAMAHFRGLFPAHEDTPGTLQMQQAFLEARDEPHAYAEGLQFLMSRGDPEPQRAGHVRWTEYDEIDDVDRWLANDADSVYAVIARGPLHDQLPEEWTLRTPGGVHIPPLDDHEGGETVAFLREVGG